MKYRIYCIITAIVMITIVVISPVKDSFANGIVITIAILSIIIGLISNPQKHKS